MVAAFAHVNGVAGLLGTKTAGRLVAASAFKVGHGYRVALPVADYYTWAGNRLEGPGVIPDVDVASDATALRAGRDPQRERATEVLRAGMAAVAASGVESAAAIR